MRFIHPILLSSIALSCVGNALPIDMDAGLRTRDQPEYPSLEARQDLGSVLDPNHNVVLYLLLLTLRCQLTPDKDNCYY